MVISRRDNEDVHTYSGIYSSMKKLNYEIFREFDGTEKNILLCKVTKGSRSQTPHGLSHMQSLASNFDICVCSCGREGVERPGHSEGVVDGVVFKGRCDVEIKRRKLDMEGFKYE